MTTEHEPDDAELITRYRSGDDTAASSLFQRHYELARRLAASIAGSSQAEDIASEAFARVLATIRKGRGPDVAFRAYLLTSVRNTYASTVRRDQRYLWVEDYAQVEGDVQVPDEALLRQESSLLATAFYTLPERWQTVLWHSTVERDSHEDVGRLLGIAPSAVAALAYRAREGLRQAYLSAHLGATSEAACRATHERLAAYTRDQLPARARREVEDHLSDCSRCTEALTDLRGLANALGAVLAPAVLGASAGAAYLESTTADTRGRRRRRTTAGLLALTGATAAIAIAAALANAGSDRSSDAGRAGPAATASPDAGPGVSPVPSPGFSPDSDASPGPVPDLSLPGRLSPDAFGGGLDDSPESATPPGTNPFTPSPGAGPGPTPRPTPNEPGTTSWTAYDLVVARTFSQQQRRSDGRTTTLGFRIESPAPRSTLTVRLSGVSSWAPDDSWPAACRVSSSGSTATAVCPLSTALQADLRLTADWSSRVKVAVSLSAPNNRDPSVPTNHTLTYQAWA